ncbi:hypothetical protein Tco_1570945, partial [Tanacetum coccineum]
DNIIVEGKGKGIATDEQATQSLLELQQPKKKNAEIGADTKNSNIKGDTEILNVDKERDEDQDGSNPGQSHVALAGPNPEPMHEDFIAKFYPQVHESLKLTTEEHFLNDKPTEEATGKANVETEVESMVTVPIHQAFLSASLLSTPIIDLTHPKLVSPPAQEPVFTATTVTTATTTTPLPLPPPQQQSTTDLELANHVFALEEICANLAKKNKHQDQTTQALSSMIFMLETHDLCLKIDNYINETVKEAVQTLFKLQFVNASESC